MKNGIPFSKIVADLPSKAPFIGPESLEREMGSTFYLRLGANESNFGISSKAFEAIQKGIQEASWYGDPENYELRCSLAEINGISPEEICVAGGIDDLLGLVVRMVISPGTPVVTSLGAYPTFNYHVWGFAGELSLVPYLEDRENPKQLLATALEKKAPLIFFSNPDNPMGTWHDVKDLQEFMDLIPFGKLLVLDEAYYEFSPKGSIPPIDTKNERVIRMRTFSKAHGMAGLRIGYAIANKKIIDGLNKIRLHFGVSRIAQIGALASLKDEQHIEDVVNQVNKGKKEYYELAEQLNLNYIVSGANFVSFDLKTRDKAKKVLKALEMERIFVRMSSAPVLERCIRVTVGNERERKIFSDVFTKVILIGKDS
ncbi:MAG: aminotransferase class I/II-fold pyridoxal phosphate-dependent enzyme [Nitrospinota bacterium]|nr:aminotransferase class I/II-fold pyridoxal phosphate-dependent enzyme [Nitrospinota bacterium]